ncbi:MULTISPECIES: hypothetical protein [Dyella]|uniref:Uncharacterized protein n=2 Tax=Dyella TaxID=231454 RepID=A0A4R0YIX7_9GAMM|nr:MULTISPECIES: hypothetical protein [Dyella]TBR36046.1 hypothetical protein EYV96_15670 [Dyella terrae]TCI06095.1 hypothetical protein EZM97_34765 [Dyella soli]
MRKGSSYCVLLLAIASTASCGGPAPPDRPSNVSASARWAGGSDGGAWYDCSQHAANVVRCALYWDNGTPAGHGLYRSTHPIKPGDIDGFDGVSVYIGSERLVEEKGG